MKELTREKVIDFLSEYKDDELLSFYEDSGVDSYEELNSFQKGALFGLTLAKVAIQNAFTFELENREKR